MGKKSFSSLTPRRKKILQLLSKNGSVLSGSEIADITGVTRQVIIKDIALLRAAGYDIIATPKGYTIRKESGSGIRAVLPVKHSYEDIEKELTLIVENGGKVLDVIVEHPIYGEIKGNLDIETIDDIKKFVVKMRTSGAKPLLELSDGLHLHTIEAASEFDLENIRKALAENSFLLS